MRRHEILCNHGPQWYWLIKKFLEPLSLPRRIVIIIIIMTNKLSNKLAFDRNSAHLTHHALCSLSLLEIIWIWRLLCMWILERVWIQIRIDSAVAPPPSPWPTRLHPEAHPSTAAHWSTRWLSHCEHSFIAPEWHFLMPLLPSWDDSLPFLVLSFQLLDRLSCDLTQIFIFTLFLVVLVFMANWQMLDSNKLN